MNSAEVFIPEDIRDILLELLEHPLAPQIGPFIALFLALVLLFGSIRVAQHGQTYCTFIGHMVLERIGFSFPWMWSSASTSTLHKAKNVSKKPRTRADQIPLNGKVCRGDDIADTGYYAGLVNTSGTYCFMLSTLQSLASLTYLQPRLESIQLKAIDLDVPTPVVDALKDLLDRLNTPNRHRKSFKPTELITALTSPTPSSSKLNQQARSASLFASREHQDAQELFQLISECIKEEAGAVARETKRDRGLGGFYREDGEDIKFEADKGVFDGLTANRRSCVECGYTEAVMHFAFDNMQLAVPRLGAGCPLEACLEEYTKLELLSDCICRKCSMKATLKRCMAETERLEAAMYPHGVSNGHTHRASEAEASSESLSSPSLGKKKRLREAKKVEARVRSALEHGRVEEDLKGVKMEKVFSKVSTKQAMIARPPLILALHLNRSMHYGHYAAKNTARIVFPEILDLTPFTTSGRLSLSPSAPISTSLPISGRDASPVTSIHSEQVLYQLSSVVCHFGQHSYGHYICYRRKPRLRRVGDERWAPPRMIDPYGCECDLCRRFGPVREEHEADNDLYGNSWLRISDEKVEECGISQVLREGSSAFMLYYERVVPTLHSYFRLGEPPYAVPQSLDIATPRSSEETLRPNLPEDSGDDGHAMGASTTHSSTGSLSRSVVRDSYMRTLEVGTHRIPGARVIRSVAIGRPRSRSLAPSEISSDNLSPGSSRTLYLPPEEPPSLTPRQSHRGLHSLS